MELGKSNVSQEDLKDLSLKKILAFIKGSKRFNLQEQTRSAQ